MADEEVLRAAELDLAVDELAEAVEPAVVETEPSPATAGPLIQVLKGNPTDEELAALVAVFTAAASASAAPSNNGPADMWGRPTLSHRGSSPFSPYAFPALSHLRD
ncbi:acyl-CoA carboxylase subunit epsilon [Nocardia sp. NPDC127526]|uniref:acyl-CoA carboxylase subunit epsilon n=1 Tax=Nocardia sp. NPDC127526 TaxID=3345393 RepID=UPI0036322868